MPFQMIYITNTVFYKFSHVPDNFTFSAASSPLHHYWVNKDQVYLSSLFLPPLHKLIVHLSQVPEGAILFLSSNPLYTQFSLPSCLFSLDKFQWSLKTQFRSYHICEVFSTFPRRGELLPPTRPTVLCSLLMAHGCSGIYFPYKTTTLSSQWNPHG